MINALYNALEAKRGFNLNMFIGVDGFVDTIIHVVDQRQDFHNYTRINSIAGFGSRILKASGLSTNIEFVPVRTKLGGNGPIYANALIEYGVNLTYAGSIGLPDIHPVFKPMSERCTAVYPLCDPGNTDALEFQDGKLMLGKYDLLGAITWERLRDKIGSLEKVADIISGSDLVGMENWTMIPHMSDIWEHMIDEVFPLLPDKAVKPAAFFDLADPEKRTRVDILRAMELIGRFEEKFRAVLGLNKKELFEIAEVFEIEAADLETTTKKLYDKLNIYCLVVHPTERAVCCTKDGFFSVEGPYCESPVLTTGAGDNFNAGFCIGQALNLDPTASLLLGVATSGYYVRKAKSPTFEAVLEFLLAWKNGLI